MILGIKSRPRFIIGPSQHASKPGLAELSICRDRDEELYTPLCRDEIALDVLDIAAVQKDIPLIDEHSGPWIEYR